MAKTGDDFFGESGLKFSGSLPSGYPHRNADNGEYHIANKAGVPEGEWYVKVRLSGRVTAEEVIEEAESVGFEATEHTTSGENSPRLSGDAGETSVVVW